MAVRQLARRACRQGTKVSCVLENGSFALDKVSTRSVGIFKNIFIYSYVYTIVHGSNPNTQSVTKNIYS